MTHDISPEMLLNIDEYFRQTGYDGVSEITKENQLKNFF